MQNPSEQPSIMKSGNVGAITALAAVACIAFATIATPAPALAPEKMATPAPAATPETKPNILFIMGDHIGCMQPSIYHRGLAAGETANSDRITNDGAMFMYNIATPRA